MRTIGSNEEQIRYSVQQAEAAIGMCEGDLCRKYGMAQATFYRRALADHLSIALVD